MLILRPFYVLTVYAISDFKLALDPLLKEKHSLFSLKWKLSQSWSFFSTNNIHYVCF
jgi:hypothetical protein